MVTLLLSKWIPVALVSVAALWPEQAFAANFGFVRWPDSLDAFLLVAAVFTAVGFAALKIQLPAGLSYAQVPREHRTTAMSLAAVVTGVSFAALMGMVFVGMGLQRLAE